MTPGIARLPLLSFASFAVLACAACSKPVDPAAPENWDFLFHDHPPERLINLWLPVPDASCLPDGLTQVLGTIDGASIQHLATQARERHPRDGVMSIHANGPYAEVLTGRECRMDTESGEGYSLRFRHENGQWRFKGEDWWVG